MNNTEYPDTFEDGNPDAKFLPDVILDEAALSRIAETAAASLRREILSMLSVEHSVKGIRLRRLPGKAELPALTTAVAHGFRLGLLYAKHGPGMVMLERHENKLLVAQMLGDIRTGLVGETGENTTYEPGEAP